MVTWGHIIISKFAFSYDNTVVRKMQYKNSLWYLNNAAVDATIIYYVREICVVRMFTDLMEISTLKTREYEQFNDTKLTNCYFEKENTINLKRLTFVRFRVVIRIGFILLAVFKLRRFGNVFVISMFHSLVHFQFGFVDGLIFRWMMSAGNRSIIRCS